jgi:hypothetical protein
MRLRSHLVNQALHDENAHGRRFRLAERGSSGWKYFYVKPHMLGEHRRNPIAPHVTGRPLETPPPDPTFGGCLYPASQYGSYQSYGKDRSQDHG